jgi:hypothetical protein
MHLASLNAHQIDQVMETFASRPAWSMNERTARGRKAVLGVYAELFRAIPDYRVRALRRHLSDGSVVVEGRMQGTQHASWFGIPPTRRRFDVPCCIVFVLDAQARIRDLRLYFDGALLLSQLRVLPDGSGAHSADTKPTRMA